MKRILSSSTILLLLQSIFSSLLIPAVFAQTTVVTTQQIVKPALEFGLQDGTPVRMRTTRTLSSADAKTGDTVDFEVLEDIKIGDLLVIPRGGTAIGTVTQGKPKGRIGKGGKLDITIDYVRLVSGEKVALRAVKETKGNSNTGAMTGAMIATGILFFPAAPLFLFMKGKDITIAKGTEITAYINGDASLDRSKFVPLPKQPAAPEVAPVTDFLNVLIKSTPDDADIIIDGKSVGRTPVQLPIKFGDHVVAITKTGYPLWQRTVTLSSSSDPNIEATLVRP
jgi:hypothetical protein